MKKQNRLNVVRLIAGSWVCLCATMQTAVAQTPVDASDGVNFGTGTDDPKLKKGDNNTDLELGVKDGSGLVIYPSSNTYPTFLAGEGHQETVSEYRWYRIAQSGTQAQGMRANALFTLRDDISGGGHSTVVFRAGVSYGDQSRMNVNLLSHSYYGLPAFTKIRILEKGVYDVFYLEVWTNRPGPVRYSIADNLSTSGWLPVDWVETTSIPTGYTIREYDINKAFTVGSYKNILSISHGGTIDIDGSLNLLSSPVLTQATAPSLLAGQYVPRSTNNAGSADSFLMEGTFGASGAIPKEGAGTRMMWYPEKSAFRVGTVSNTDWDDVNIGLASIAMGDNTKASGQNSVSLGGWSQALGSNSTALGAGHAYACGSLATGYNTPRFTSSGRTAWQGDDLNSAFEVGIGANESNRKNGFTVLQDGSVEVGKATASDDSVPLHVKANGDVTLSKAQGDISMGVFGQ